MSDQPFLQPSGSKRHHKKKGQKKGGSSETQSESQAQPGGNRKPLNRGQFTPENTGGGSSLVVQNKVPATNEKVTKEESKTSEVASGNVETVTSGSIYATSGLLNTLLDEMSLTKFRSLLGNRLKCCHCANINILLQGDVLELGENLLKVLQENKLLRSENDALKSAKNGLPEQMVDVTNHLHSTAATVEVPLQTQSNPSLEMQNGVPISDMESMNLDGGYNEAAAHGYQGTHMGPYHPHAFNRGTDIEPAYYDTRSQIPSGTEYMMPVTTENLSQGGESFNTSPVERTTAWGGSPLNVEAQAFYAEESANTEMNRSTYVPPNANVADTQKGKWGKGDGLRWGENHRDSSCDKYQTKNVDNSDQSGGSRSGRDDYRDGSRGRNDSWSGQNNGDNAWRGKSHGESGAWEPRDKKRRNEEGRGPDNHQQREGTGRGRGRERHTRGDGGKPERSFKIVKETFGDLFMAPKDHALAHCVAEDMRMGSGIAVTFRSMFKGVEELLDQGRRPGQVAFLEHEGRFIYYLVTKKVSNGKPRFEDLVSSLEEMKKHCVEHAVKNIAMPRIGCGLDRLEWSQVKDALETTFLDTDVSITVYNFQQEMAEQDAPAQRSKLVVTQKLMHLVSIQQDTALVFLGTEDSYIDETITSLDAKYHFVEDYKRARKIVGEVVRIEKREYLYGLIVKKTNSDPFSYKVLHSCLLKFRNLLNKDKYEYFGIEAFTMGNDDLAMEKVITLLRSVFFSGRRLEVWICWPPSLQEVYNEYNKPPSSYSYQSSYSNSNNFKK